MGLETKENGVLMTSSDAAFWCLQLTAASNRENQDRENHDTHDFLTMLPAVADSLTLNMDDLETVAS